MGVGGLRIFFPVLYIILLVPTGNYTLSGLGVVILLPFIRGISQGALMFALLVILLIVLNLGNFEIENFKYFLAILVSIVLSRNRKLERFLRTSSFIILAVMLAELEYTDFVRSFFRASNQELHYERCSSLFLYPGDLGTFGAILISLELFNTVKYSRFNGINLFFVLLGAVFVFYSQSRMALAQISITLLFYLFYRPFVVFGFLIVGISVFSLTDFNLDYLMREDFVELFLSFNPTDDNAEGNKRAEEFVALFLSSNSSSEFYEGSVPSFISRFGVYGFMAFVLLYLTQNRLRFWNGKVLLVMAPLIVTSFIGAPFERPKLLLLSFGAVWYVLNSVKYEKIQGTY